jgi:hypothetical protein
MIVIPILTFLLAKKTISFDSKRFLLNESLMLWLIMMILGSFIST